MNKLNRKRILKNSIFNYKTKGTSCEQIEINTGTNNQGVYFEIINATIQQLDLALQIHKRVLVISAGDSVVARIRFYGEGETEDDRLKVLLANLGASLESEDFMIFKSHDISEMHPDYQLLNQKRKELLLELNNIKPFVGTYKAILNAIDFFGYDKITLKEYWINIASGTK